MEIPCTNDYKIDYINEGETCLDLKKESSLILANDIKTSSSSESSLKELSNDPVYKIPLPKPERLKFSSEKGRTETVSASYITSSRKVLQSQTLSHSGMTFSNVSPQQLYPQLDHCNENKAPLNIIPKIPEPNALTVPDPPRWKDDFEDSEDKKPSLSLLWLNCSQENSKSEHHFNGFDSNTKEGDMDSLSIQVYEGKNAIDINGKTPTAIWSQSDTSSITDAELYYLKTESLPVVKVVKNKDSISAWSKHRQTNLHSTKKSAKFESLKRDTTWPKLDPNVLQSKQLMDETSKTVSSQFKNSCKPECILKKENSIEYLEEDELILRTPRIAFNSSTPRDVSNNKFSSSLDRSTARCFDEDEYFQEMKDVRSTKSSPNSRYLLSGILASTLDSTNRGSVFSKLKRIQANGPKLKAQPSYESTLATTVDGSGSDGSQSFYWERFMRQVTVRRRSEHKRKKIWQQQTIDSVAKEINLVDKVMDKKTYYAVFRLNNGRTNPWQELVLSLVWTTVFLCLHKDYLNLGERWLGCAIDPWFSSSFINYFSIALGFLLYMQADLSSARWWEGRVHWQMIIQKSKRLAVLLNTHLSCLRLSRAGTRMIIAHIICVRNYIQEKSDPVWRQELLQVLDMNVVKQIMKQPRRLRYLGILYGFQRLIQVCIQNRILEKQVIRDINPTIISMGRSLGTCNRVRSTRLPWVIAMHLQFMLFVYIAVLPMTLVSVQNYKQWEFVALTKINFVDIYIYVLIIAYAFFGLSRMALEIDNPFSFTRENHSFGFWGFYEFWSAQEIFNVRSIFGWRTNRVGAKGNAIYGSNWVSSKLKILIECAINCKLSEFSNLYGRTEQIRQQLEQQETSSTLPNVNFTESEGEFSSFTLASCSEPELVEIGDRSISEDRAKSQKRKKRRVEQKFPLTPPKTQSPRKNEGSILKKYTPKPETADIFVSITNSFQKSYRLKTIKPFGKE